MWNAAVGIKNCKQLFSLRLAFTTQKKATHTAEMMSVLCVAICWVLNANSGVKSCLQFSIPTGSGQVGREPFQIVLTWIIEGSIRGLLVHPNKTLRFVAHQRPWSEDREKKKSIKFFIFYIFLNNTSYCSISLYYEYIEMSAKHKYILFSFLECKLELVHRSAWNRAREPNQESPRAWLCVQLDVIL